jgi:hypothetical protein
MTTFRLPPEPAGPVWLHHPEVGVVRAIRSPGARPGGWVWDVENVPDHVFSWPEMLALGDVQDEHPDLAGLPPFPWAVETGDVDQVFIENGEGRAFLELPDVLDSYRIAELIVAAVNAYAAQLGAIETTCEGGC